MCEDDRGKEIITLWKRESEKEMTRAASGVCVYACDYDDFFCGHENRRIKERKTRNDFANDWEIYVLKITMMMIVAV